MEIWKSRMIDETFAKEQEECLLGRLFDNVLLVFVDIQSWWEVPSIAHFCSLFRDAFNLLDFDIEVPTKPT